MSTEAQAGEARPLSVEEAIRRPMEPGTGELPAELEAYDPQLPGLVGEEVHTFAESEIAGIGGDSAPPSARPQWADLTHAPRPSFIHSTRRFDAARCTSIRPSAM